MTEVTVTFWANIGDSENHWPSLCATRHQCGRNGAARLVNVKQYAVLTGGPAGPRSAERALSVSQTPFPCSETDIQLWVVMMAFQGFRKRTSKLKTAVLLSFRYL